MRWVVFALFWVGFIMMGLGRNWLGHGGDWVVVLGGVIAVIAFLTAWTRWRPVPRNPTDKRERLKKALAPKDK